MSETTLKHASAKGAVRVGLKAVAQRANVSVATVSMALADHPDIRTETKRRIWQLSGEMGYQGKQRSTARARRMLKRIGFMQLGTETNDLNNTTILHQLMVACSDSDISLQVAAVELKNLAKAAERTAAMAKEVDALMLMHHVGTDTFGALNAAGVPFVVVGYSLATVREAMEARVHIVTVDDMSMGQTATEALIGAGHTRIGFVCESMPRNLSHWRFYNGYSIAHRDAGLPVDPRLLHVAGRVYSNGVEAAEAMSRVDPPPTAYVAPDARIGANFIAAMRRRGTPVAKDSVVIACDPGVIEHHGLSDYPLVIADHQSLVAASLRQLQLVYEDRSMSASIVQVPFNVRNLPQPKQSSGG